MAKSKKTEIVEASAAAVDKPKKERKPRAVSIKFRTDKNASSEEKAKLLYRLSRDAKSQGQNPVKISRTRSLLTQKLAGSGHKIEASDGVLQAIVTIAHSQMTRCIHEAARLAAAVGGHQMVTVRDIEEAAKACGQDRFYARHVLAPLPSTAKGELVEAN